MKAPFSTSSSDRPGPWLLLRRGLLLLALAASGLSLVSALLPRVANSFFCGYWAKHERLHALGAGKLVVCGGSNVAFGVDTRYLEKETGRPGVNLAMGAGLGLAFMVNEACPEIRQGDVVLFLPEYELFFESSWRGSSSLGLLLFDVPEAWESVSLANAPALPEVWLQALHIRLSTVFNTRCFRNLREVEPIYHLGAFDDRGDVVAHLDKPQTLTPFGAHFLGADARPDASAIRLLRELAARCQSQGAILLVFPPSLQDSVYLDHKEFIDGFWADLRRQLGATVQGQPADYVFPRDHLFDSVYHLSRRGRQQRTERLGAELAAVLREEHMLDREPALVQKDTDPCPEHSCTTVSPPTGATRPSSPRTPCPASAVASNSGGDWLAGRRYPARLLRPRPRRLLGSRPDPARRRQARGLSLAARQGFPRPHQPDRPDHHYPTWRPPLRGQTAPRRLRPGPRTAPGGLQPELPGQRQRRRGSRELDRALRRHRPQQGSPPVPLSGFRVTGWHGAVGAVQSASSNSGLTPRKTVMWTKPLLAMLVLGALVLRAEPLVDESFETDLASLRAGGWRLPSGSSVAAPGREGKHCLRLDRPEKKGYAELFVPVEQGKIYRAKAWVKCENVVADETSSLNRGAVLFCQFADKDKQWRPGGAFPKGLHGTKDWQLLEVRHTAAIPDGVAFIQFMVGIEGRGTAWFDGVELEEITGWDTPKARGPEDGAAVDSKRPFLTWEAVLPQESYELELSTSADFPADGTRKQLVWDREARPDAPLVPGTWYWRLRTVTAAARLPATQPRHFTVPADAADWPPRFAATWTSNAASLSARLAPAPWVSEVSATIAGQPATVTRVGDALSITPVQPLAKGVHEVRVQARNGQGQEIEFVDLYSAKAPAAKITFREDGVMLLDGTPFFPLASYRDPSDTRTDFAGLHEAGFNVTHDYYFENTDRTIPEARDYLRAAEAAGLKVFLGLGRPSIRRNDVMGWKRWVGELMDEPGLLTWYMMDEPMCQDVPQAAFVGLQQAIRQMDGGHPASLLLARISPVTDFQRAYAATCDVLWCDPYPVPDQSLLTVAQKAEACRDAAGPGKPFWVVLQGFDWRYAREGKKALEKYGQEITSPTPDETRAMAHLALSTGTQGLIWYWSPNSIYHIQRQAPTVWQGICETVQELNRLQPFLIAARGPADTIDLPAPFRSWSRATDGKRVLAVVNASGEPARLVLPGNRRATDWRTDQPPADAPIPAWGTAIYIWSE